MRDFNEVAAMCRSCRKQILNLNEYSLAMKHKLRELVAEDAPQRNDSVLESALAEDGIKRKVRIKGLE
jgi:hypothetical protein